MTPQTSIKECCSLDNMEAFTANGKTSSRVNCLVCRTCKEQQTFSYLEENDMNLVWSYVRLGIARQSKGFSPIHSLNPQIKPIEPPKPRPDASHAEKILSILDRSMLDG